MTNRLSQGARRYAYANEESFEPFYQAVGFEEKRTQCAWIKLF